MSIAQTKRKKTEQEFSDLARARIDRLNRMFHGEIEAADEEGRDSTSVRKKRLKKWVRGKRNAINRRRTERISLTTRGKMEMLYLMRPNETWSELDRERRNHIYHRFIDRIENYRKSLKIPTNERHAFAHEMLTKFKAEITRRMKSETDPARWMEMHNLSEYAEEILRRYEGRPSHDEAGMRGRSPPRRREKATKSTANAEEAKRRGTGREVPQWVKPRVEIHPDSLEARVKMTEAEHFKAREKQEAQRLAEKEVLEKWRSARWWRKWRYGDYLDPRVRKAVIKEQQKRVSRTPSTDQPNAFKRGWNATKRLFSRKRSA